MATFWEFLLVASALYLWESILWLPKSGFAMRAAWFGKKWRIVSATSYFSTRELGLIPTTPILPDGRLVPCAEFPLIADELGQIFVEIEAGEYRSVQVNSWDQVRYTAPHLLIGDLRIRSQSPAALDFLKECKSRGDELTEAIRKMTTRALSPARAKREQKRCRILSAPLRVFCPLLSIAFFAGLPVLYLLANTTSLLCLAVGLWSLMLTISVHLLKLAKKASPSARAAIRQDAFLCLLIPFHAMKALEITSVHFFSQTHPCAFLIAQGDWQNPWLCSFLRKLLFPRPEHSGDAARSAAILPALEKIFKARNKTLSDYERAPLPSDEAASSYCPRCHASFLPITKTCTDCSGMPLRGFET